jgi:glycogen debranching enzyme
MAYSGKFTPRNPQKYEGDHNNIIYRSSWECKVMSWLDKTPSILSWSSEQVIIPYKSPVDGRYHRYFPDFRVKTKGPDGKPRTLILEVKPYKQTQQPKQRKRVTKQYITEVATWGVNQAKWKAANEYCLDRGWEFKILTEKELGIN